MQSKEEKKQEINIKKDLKKLKKGSVVIPIKKEIEKLESGIYHDGKKLLYEQDEEFESCCFKCDKPLCLYIGKMFIGVSVLFFCMFMLQNKENSAEFYTGTIAGLLGHFLNNSIQQNQKKKKDDKI